MITWARQKDQSAVANAVTPSSCAWCARKRLALLTFSVDYTSMPGTPLRWEQVLQKIASLIQNYFLLWIEHKEFQKELQKEGFDISGNLKESKIIFQKYMAYFSAVEDQIEKIKKGDNVVSRDVLILISSGLLSSDPQYQKIWEELYQNLPGMRKSLDQYMTNMIKSYKEFKKRLNSKD